jgi:hypothetical protein
MSGPIPRPGRGWKRYPNTGVFEHAPTGIRIHLHGLVWFPDGTIEDVSRWPVVKRWWWHNRCAGGKQRRGLMTYALELHSQRGAA